MMKNNQTCIRQYADQVQINACKEKLKTSVTTIQDFSHALALAGNEVRLKMLFLLHEEKELCPCDLADILEMTIPAISQHLRKMKDGQLIQSRREGQNIFYSLTPTHDILLQPILKTIQNQTNTKEAAL